MNPTDQYALVGYPVAHSLSPLIHARFAGQTGQQLHYGTLEVPPAEFSARVRQFFADGGRGLNITLPHKIAAYALADELTPRARAAGAINCLQPQPGGGLLGDNTDGAGLVRDLTVNLGLELHERSILMLGAGGAARGVVLPLLAEGPRRLAIANRTAARAAELVASFAQPKLQAITDVSRLAEPFDVIINATSAHHSGERFAVPAAVLGKHTFCYDMGYKPEGTPFMAWARANGAVGVASGLGMLVEQAAEAFYLWRGVRPDTLSVIAALGAGLSP